MRETSAAASQTALIVTVCTTSASGDERACCSGYQLTSAMPHSSESTVRSRPPAEARVPGPFSIVNATGAPAREPSRLLI